jgi:hypothetical protein
MQRVVWSVAFPEVWRMIIDGQDIALDIIEGAVDVLAICEIETDRTKK